MINLMQGDCLEKMKDYLLTVQYRDDTGPSEPALAIYDEYREAA
jgi:hypothetical protein